MPVCILASIQTAPDPPSGRRGRSLLARDARRAQILAAAAGAFAGAGFQATSMDDVARAAGITKLIVYRHFDSKAELYREILEEVATRLAEEWSGPTDSEHSRGSAAEVLLTVARELPDGFRLLFVHAPREAEFATYHAEFRALQLDLADRLFAPLVTDELIRRWLCRQTVDHLVDSVLNWTDLADPVEDGRFADMATAVITAMVEAARR